ncbi:MAG: PIN domain-containing protein [Ignisphaera sp.]
MIARQGYSKEMIDAVYSFLKDMNIEIVTNYFNYDGYVQLIQGFKLLPNDAQIALTCRHYDIDTILTFDNDFKRVSWLWMVP